MYTAKVEFNYKFQIAILNSLATVCRPEGSFLLWLDFTNTGYSHEECGEKLLKKGKIGLNDGLTFGEEGRGFRRMNIGCPRIILEEGLRRIKKAVKLD